MYADDATLHTAHSQLSVIEQRLNADMNLTKQWCKQNNMSLNLNKTTCMLIGSRQRLCKVRDINVLYNNCTVKTVAYQKVLGINIDKNLSWNIHIDKICSDVSKRISLLRRLDRYLDKDAKLLYYNAYILPIMDYGAIVWGHCNNLNIERICKLQKRAARLILHKPIRYPSNELFKELNWLSFSERVKYLTGVMVYKSLNNLAPSYLSNILLPLSQSSHHVTRAVSNQDLAVQRHNTELFKQSFTYSSSSVWNSLDTGIKQSLSLKSFKYNLRNHIINK